MEKAKLKKGKMVTVNLEFTVEKTYHQTLTGVKMSEAKFKELQKIEKDDYVDLEAIEELQDLLNLNDDSDDIEPIFDVSNFKVFKS